MLQHSALVHGHVIGLVALDLVLWIVPAAVTRVTLVGGVAGMHLGDVASDMTSLRVSAYVVANLELAHVGLLGKCEECSRCQTVGSSAFG